MPQIKTTMVLSPPSISVKRGLPANKPFTIEELWAARPAQFAVELFSTAKSSRAKFAFDRKDLGKAERSVEAIYINTASLAGASISYGVKVTLEASDLAGGKYLSTCFQALDVRPEAPDLQGYGEELAEKHGLDIVINPANVAEVDPDAL
jgi:hypothetical protein